MTAKELLTNENWFRPYGSEKEAVMAALSLLYDGEYEKVEWLNFDWEHMSECDFHATDISIIEDFVQGARKARPIHKHRALIDLYWKYPACYKQKIYWNQWGPGIEGPKRTYSPTWQPERIIIPSQENPTVYAVKT